MKLLGAGIRKTNPPVMGEFIAGRPRQAAGALPRCLTRRTDCANLAATADREIASWRVSGLRPSRIRVAPGIAAFQHVNDHALFSWQAAFCTEMPACVRVENHRSDQNAESHNAHRIVLRLDRTYQGRGRRTVARGLPSRHAPAAGVRHPACASSPQPKNDVCSTIPNGCRH